MPLLTPALLRHLVLTCRRLIGRSTGRDQNSLYFTREVVWLKMPYNNSECNRRRQNEARLSEEKLGFESVIHRYNLVYQTIVVIELLYAILWHLVGQDDEQR